MNSIIEKRKQNWLDFYDLNSPVRRLLLLSYPLEIKGNPDLTTQEGKEEAMYQRYMLQLENMEKVDDNTIPHIPISGGTGIFAQAFGCQTK